MEFALGAVPVEHEVGRRGAGEQRCEFFQTLPHFACQGGGLHLERGVVVAVDDLADGDVASKSLREHEGVEGHQHLVVSGEFVAIDEADGNKLRRLAPPLRRDALHGVEF